MRCCVERTRHLFYFLTCLVLLDIDINSFFLSCMPVYVFAFFFYDCVFLSTLFFVSWGFLEILKAVEPKERTPS